MEIKLRPIDLTQDIDIAVDWYQNRKILDGSEGRNAQPYSKETLQRMYHHLNSIGEVYIIEVKEHDWKAIGDATLAKETLPIVIGDTNYHGKGIGSSVLTKLIERAVQYNWSELNVKMIYDYNIASQKMYEKAGFIKVDTAYTKEGQRYYSYHLEL